jgi:hypothetical protein
VACLKAGLPACYERVLETGLIVTYARPYLESNKLRVGKRWLPESGADREFHQWLIATSCVIRTTRTPIERPSDAR